MRCTPSNHHRVFVYGTLRRGCSNHHYLARCRFIGCGWTRHRYALYLAEFPCVVSDSRIARIRGEVYRVDPAVLEALDQLEGHPDSYRRSQVSVDLDDGRCCRAWLYFFPVQCGVLLPGGDYLGADRFGD